MRFFFNGFHLMSIGWMGVHTIPIKPFASSTLLVVSFAHPGLALALVSPSSSLFFHNRKWLHILPTLPSLTIHIYTWHCFFFTT